MVVKEAARLLLLETAGDQAGADQQVVLPEVETEAENSWDDDDDGTGSGDLLDH